MNTTIARAISMQKFIMSRRQNTCFLRKRRRLIVRRSTAKNNTMNTVHMVLLVIVLLKVPSELDCIEGANNRIATKGLHSDMERRSGMFSNFRASGTRSRPSSAVSISMPKLRFLSFKATTYLRLGSLNSGEAFRCFVKITNR